MASCITPGDLAHIHHQFFSVIYMEACNQPTSSFLLSPVVMIIVLLCLQLESEFDCLRMNRDTFKDDILQQVMNDSCCVIYHYYYYISLSGIEKFFFSLSNLPRVVAPPPSKPKLHISNMIVVVLNCACRRLVLILIFILDVGNKRIVCVLATCRRHEFL